VEVGGFYFIVAQNQTDLTGLMPPDRARNLKHSAAQRRLLGF